MHRGALILLPVAVGLAGCGGGGAASLGSDDVATVGSDHITRAQYDQILGQAEANYKKQGRPFPNSMSSGQMFSVRRSQSSCA